MSVQQIFVIGVTLHPLGLHLRAAMWQEEVSKNYVEVLCINFLSPSFAIVFVAFTIQRFVLNIKKAKKRNASKQMSSIFFKKYHVHKAYAQYSKFLFSSFIFSYDISRMPLTFQRGESYTTAVYRVLILKEVKQQKVKSSLLLLW